MQRNNAISASIKPSENINTGYINNDTVNWSINSSIFGPAIFAAVEAMAKIKTPAEINLSLSRNCDAKYHKPPITVAKNIFSDVIVFVIPVVIPHTD